MVRNTVVEPESSSIVYFGSSTSVNDLASSDPALGFANRKT